ncbi:PilZ domain-containing protein [Thermopirellula anaerolimosa]
MGSPVIETQNSEQPQVSHPTPEQRRKHERFNYPVVQKICPYRGDVVPGAARFFPVKCKDLSRNGLSFYLDYEPSFERFIVLIRTGDRHDFVAGEVVHVQPMPEDATGRFLVGCRLLKKVQSRVQLEDEE